MSVNAFGAWGLIDADHYPAKQKQVSALLSTIRKIKLGLAVTHRKVHHQKLQVSEESYERRIKLRYDHVAKDEESGLEKTEKRELDFFIGTKPQRDRVHFRMAGDDTVYVVSGLDSWNIGVNLGEWTNKQYIDVPDEILWEVKIENKQGRLHLIKHPSEGWTVKNWLGTEPPNQVDVAAMARRAASIELHAPLGKTEKPGYGLENPQATVTLVTSTSTRTDQVPTKIEKQQYWIGRQSTDDLFFVKAANAEHHVKVRPVEVNGLVDASLSSLK